MIDIEKWKSFGDFVTENWLAFAVGVLVGGGVASAFYERFLLPTAQGPARASAARQDTVQVQLHQELKSKVLLMDSADSDLVYEKETREAGGSNLDDLNDLLKDLPGIEILTEVTSPIWRRDEQVLQLDPDLIVVHISCFYSESNPLDWDDRFRAFLRYMEGSSARFLVYSRGLWREDYTEEKRKNWQDNMSYLAGEDFLGRLLFFELEGGELASFRNPGVARKVKARIKELLPHESEVENADIDT